MSTGHEIDPHLCEVIETAVHLYEQGSPEAAFSVMMRAVSEDRNSAGIWRNVAHFAWETRRYPECAEACEKSLALDPQDAEVWNTYGLAMEALARYDRARNAFNTSCDLDPKFATARWNRGLLNLAIGNYRDGFEEYDARIERKPDTYADRPAPLWRGQGLAGKTIYVENEQGIGDTILYSRFLPQLAQRAEKIYFAAPQNITALLWEMQSRKFEFLPVGVPIPKTDYTSFMASLPRWLNCEFPPVDPGLIKKRVDFALSHPSSRIEVAAPPDDRKGIKVGICWTGNPGQDRNVERSVPFELMARLAEDYRVWVYSLQGPPANGVIAAKRYNDLVFDLGVECMARGLVALGTAISQLDVVVTCCTSVAHLAGALGVKAWLLLHHDPYWVWCDGTRENNDWYPSVRSFRQTRAGNWEDVIERVRANLASLLKD